MPAEAYKLEMVISGGQTGVDRAALDAAMSFGMAVGGYCPRGRKAEDGKISDRYPLTETTSSDYRVRTEKNVLESDGTLILNMGRLSGGTALTLKLAAKYQKPHLILQLDMEEELEPEVVSDWLVENGIESLNVAGNRESKAPGVYRKAFDFLVGILSAMREQSLQ